MKIKINNKKGFTLLETLIAIFILTLSITGPVYIASLSFRNTIDSRDNIVAQYLAEEVVEVLKNKRDRRVLESPTKHWLWTDSSSSITGGKDCFNKYEEDDDLCVMFRDSDNDYSFLQCSGGICPNIPLNVDGDIVYGEVDVETESKFVREFHFEKGKFDSSLPDSDIPDREVDLIVNIRWQNKGQEKMYTLRERLYAVNYSLYFNQ